MTPDKINTLPLSSGVYLMKDASGKIIYIGKAVNLRRRVQSYFRGRGHAPLMREASSVRVPVTKTDLLVENIAGIDVIQTHSEAEALILEAALVKEHLPKYNIDLKDAKSYPYIEITGDEFPLVSVIRFVRAEQKKSDAAYFGPYVDAPLIRQALTLIRKIFPFRTCKVLPDKACLYHNIGLCDAPCIGKISKEDYRRNIRHITLILEGRKDELYRGLKVEMDRLSHEKDFERAAKVRDQLRAMGALYASSPDANYFKELEQLERALDLPRRPERVECIDISTTMGERAVGSLVSFLNGKPDKANYRRFRIKEVVGMDDFKMVAEVVRRRYGRLKREGAAYPDLVVIDGGKGQLGAAFDELKRLDVNIPLISLAKREEEIFLPSKRKAVLLAKDSLALKLVQRLRDEAHRFAIAYHRKLRSKKMFNVLSTMIFVVFVLTGGMRAWAAPVLSADERAAISTRIADGLVALADPATFVAPSHLGHPGYKDAAFVYDKAVDALVLYAADRDDAAHALLDYFAEKLRIPLEDVRRHADANGIWGILKLYPSVDDPRGVGFLNAINCRSVDTGGEGQVEYSITPGPVAFMIMAFLHVDRQEYLPVAEKLGEVLLLMQRADGAIVDGDRDPRSVHTEPHMDGYSALLMLYDVTGEARWREAAEHAWDWFMENVYRPQEDVIYQGMRPAGASDIFATDTYSWTMAGRGGERLPLDVLDRLSDRMLRRGLSRVTLELPDGTTKTMTLTDFADIHADRVRTDRGGVHAMGSIEWIGGVILALQKNAVRFWQEGDEVFQEKGRFYKAMAEYLTRQALEAFYEIDGVYGLLSFYATGQNVATGHGWRTPYFYVKDPAGKMDIKGGSTISAWLVLPLRRSNPFKLGDDYGEIYNAIPLDESIEFLAEEHINDLVRERVFTEEVPTEISSDIGELPEMWRYNVNMFEALNMADYYAATLWAHKVVDNGEWRRLAADQQARKARDIGGLVAYPWGTTLVNAKEQERLIRKYPLLNEMGAAMWGLAVAQHKFGNNDEAKVWIKALIETLPLHQVFAPEGPGYWNALVSWETNPGGSVLDAEMSELYRQVLREMGVSSAMPKTSVIK